MRRPRPRRVVPVLGVLVLAACASSPEEGAGVPTAAVDTLVCGDGGYQSGSVALAEGAGFPDPLAAVEDAQGSGWLPAGEAEVVDEQGNGVVRSDDGTVVAGFLIEDVGEGWHVTRVDTCADG